MKFNLSPTLQNAKVILRPLQLSDEAALQSIANDKECWMYSPLDLSQPGALRQYIIEAIAEKEAGTCAVFTIIDATTNQIAGSTRLAEISWQHEHAHLGWTWIAPEFRGTGLNKAMKFEILRYGFEMLGLNRIQLRADERNIRSCKAIASLGAKYEGTVRQHIKLYDGFYEARHITAY